MSLCAAIASRTTARESKKRIVQLDHEAILQHGEMKVVKEMAPSFVDFVHAALHGH
jgi:hypothetical protein